MLLPLTLGLVIASAILLVLGFVQSALGLVYVALLCAGVAALALFVFARLAKRRADSAVATDSASTCEPAAPAAPAAPADEDEREYAEGEWFFPIEDYDELRVADILPLIPLLEPEELEEVRDHEAATKNRKTILSRLDGRLGRTVSPAPAAAGKKTAPAGHYSTPA